MAFEFLRPTAYDSGSFDNPEYAYDGGDGSSHYWNINGATHNSSDQWDISTNTNIPILFCWADNGTKFYVVDDDDVCHIDYYTASTAYDPNTLVYVSTLDVDSIDGATKDVIMSEDGLTMWTVGSSHDEVYEWTLSTAWDITSATNTASFNVHDQDSAPKAICFNPDKSKLYMTGSGSNYIYEYDLSVNGDITTMVYNGVSIPAQGTYPTGLAFSSDGLYMYQIKYYDDIICQYELSEAWNIETADFATNSVTIDAAPYTWGIDFNADGSEIFFMDHGGKEIWKSVLTDNGGGIDNNTYSSTTSYNDTDVWKTWESTSETYSNLTLKIIYEFVGNATDDTTAIQYSIDGGTNWVDALSSGVHAQTAKTTLSISLSSSQDLSQLQVRTIGSVLSTADDQIFKIWEIYTEGEIGTETIYYGSATLTGASQLNGIGQITTFGVASIESDGLFNLSGQITQYGDFSIVGIGDLSIKGTIESNGSAILTGVSTQTVSGLIEQYGEFILCREFLTENGNKIEDGLGGYVYACIPSSIFLCDGGTYEGVYHGSATLNSNSNVSLHGLIEYNGEFSLIGKSLFNADGSIESFGLFELIGTSLLEADGKIILPSFGSALLIGRSNVFVDGKIYQYYFGEAHLDGVGEFKCDSFLWNGIIGSFCDPKAIYNDIEADAELINVKSDATLIPNGADAIIC